MIEAITFIVMTVISYTIFLSVIYLSSLSWYEREEEEAVARSLKLGFILGLILGFGVYFLAVTMPNLYVVYASFALVGFILAIIGLYPLITWIRKRIYYYFYLVAYLAYNVLTWYLFALFLMYVLEMDPITTIVASYLVGAIMGTLLATAVIKEIRPKEIIFGGLSAVVTAISIADFGTRLLSQLMPAIIVVGSVKINWIFLFLVGSLIMQLIYYRFMVNR